MQNKIDPQISPLEKYVLYGKFPWKLVLHTLLVIFTTYQILCVIEQRTANTRSEHIVMRKALLGIDEDNDIKQIFSLTDFQEQLNSQLDTLTNLDDILIQKLDIKQATYNINIYYSHFNVDNAKQSSFPVDITQGYVEQPFDSRDVQSIKDFVQEVSLIEFQGDNIYNYVQFQDTERRMSCFKWSFTIKYNFAKVGVIDAIISTQNTNNCNNVFKDGGQTFIFIHLIVLILGSISLFVSINQIYNSGAVYLHHKDMYKQVQELMLKPTQSKDSPDISNASPQFMQFNPPTLEEQWKEGHFESDLEVFNFWFLVSGLSGFFATVGALIAILDSFIMSDLQIFKIQEKMMGFGCFFAWILVLKYLEYFSNINMMTRTLKQSSRNILMFLVGIIPFFFGFAFLAESIFSRFTYFRTTLDSITALFSLANGDILLETFTTTWPEGIFGQIFIIIFMILFFTAIQSVLVAIIMEGFETSSRNQKVQIAEQQQIQEQVQEQLSYKHYEPIAQCDVEEDDKEIIISKLQFNMKRVKKLIEEIDALSDEISDANLKYHEKLYLMNVLKENSDNISRNIKFQISNMES